MNGARPLAEFSGRFLFSLGRNKLADYVTFVRPAEKALGESGGTAPKGDQ